MVAVPADSPVTTPAKTVAIRSSELLHVPPAVVLLRVIVDPSQTSDRPVSAAGEGLTVTVIVNGEPAHEPVVELGVTIYSMEPAVASLGFISV